MRMIWSGPERASDAAIFIDRDGAVNYRRGNDYVLDIGDLDSDVKAVQAVGCHPVLFGPGSTACADSWQWMKNLPVAPTAKNLFQVTVGTLQKATPTALSAGSASPRLS